MKVKIYHYPKCGTCRKAMKWLAAQGFEVEDVNVFEAPPSPSELSQLIERSGLDIKKFFNTSGEAYKEMKLKDNLPQMSDQEKIVLLSSNGRLIKRPIVTDNRKVTVGFKEEQFAQAWNKANSKQ